MNYRPLLLLMAALAWLAGTVRADDYAMDPAHSTVGFSVTHLVINKVHGTFDEFTAHVTYDPTATPPVKDATATIQAASIDTRNKKRDDHLRSPDFFDVTKHAELTFVTKSVKADGANWVANGTLTIRGVAKEIALPFSLKGPIKDPWGKTRVAIDAKTTINRKDFGLTWNKVLEAGGVMVGDEVEIEIQGEFVKQ